LRFRLSYAGPRDIGLMVEHRLNMWRDIHPELGEEIEESRRVTRHWVRRNMANGRLIGLIARAPDGRVAGSGCIWMREEQPRPDNPGLERPYLMSMYTEEEFRRKGVAKLIARGAIKWCRDNGHGGIALHASKVGRPLYESLGFEPSSEMRLKLHPKRAR